MVLPLLVNSLFGLGILSHPYNRVLKSVLTAMLCTSGLSYKYQPTLSAIPRRALGNNG